MTNVFATLAQQFLNQNTYYGGMSIPVQSLVNAYHVFRSTDYHGNSDNEEGHNYERDEQMALIMGGTDWNNGDYYVVWSVLAGSFDDYLKKLLRAEYTPSSL